MISLIYFWGQYCLTFGNHHRRIFKALRLCFKLIKEGWWRWWSLPLPSPHHTHPKRKSQNVFTTSPQKIVLVFDTCFPKYNLTVTQLELLILVSAATIFNYFHNFLTCLSVTLFCNKEIFLLI